MGEPVEPPPAEVDATPFEDVDVEEDVTAETRVTEGDTLTDEEVADIAGQLEQIEAANQARGADDQISTAPEDVS